MVLAFFRRARDTTAEHIEQEILTMLSDCRHSFDLAMSALTTDGDIAPIGDEVHATDDRINGAEESVRRELIVHSAVREGADINMVLTSLLIVKKLERAGDQNKNIFDLAAENVRFSGADDYEEFQADRNEVSSIIAAAVPLLHETDDAVVDAFDERTKVIMADLNRRITALIHAETPAHHAVPRAMLYRYLKRIVANIAGVVMVMHRPIDRRHMLDLDE